MVFIPDYHEALLSWYSAYHRSLPWRSLPGEQADPYLVWISEIMLQQTTVAIVKDYYVRFLTKWPTIESLAQATMDEVLHAWQGLGYYSRARNLYKCALVIQREHRGRFPSDEKELLKLPGIGSYTASAIRSIAFGLPATVVDGNIERILSRLFRLETPLPSVKKEIHTKAEALISTADPSSYAQALMDLGAMICTPQNPKCSICPIRFFCQSFGKDPEAFPKRLSKSDKPIRYGTFLWIENEKGEILLEKRPSKGLLAELMGFPSFGWDSKQDSYQWNDVLFFQKTLKQPIKHTFTHFHLIGTVVMAQSQKEKIEGTWASLNNLKDYALPRLMHKVKEAVLKEVQQ